MNRPGWDDPANGDINEAQAGTEEFRRKARSKQYFKLDPNYVDEDPLERAIKERADDIRVVTTNPGMAGVTFSLETDDDKDENTRVEHVAPPKVAGGGGSSVQQVDAPPEAYEEATQPEERGCCCIIM